MKRSFILTLAFAAILMTGCNRSHEYRLDVALIVITPETTEAANNKLKEFEEYYINEKRTFEGSQYDCHKQATKWYEETKAAIESQLLPLIRVDENVYLTLTTLDSNKTLEHVELSGNLPAYAAGNLPPVNLP